MRGLKLAGSVPAFFRASNPGGRSKLCRTRLMLRSTLKAGAEEGTRHRGMRISHLGP